MLKQYWDHCSHNAVLPSELSPVRMGKRPYYVVNYSVTKGVDAKGGSMRSRCLLDNIRIFITGFVSISVQFYLRAYYGYRKPTQI